MSKKIKHRFRKEFLYYCALALLEGSRLIPARLLYVLCAGGGWCAYSLLRRERRKALDNLALAYGGEKSARERTRIARAVFANMGRTMAELALSPRLDAARLHELVSMEGKEIVDRERKKGKGIIIITGHLGNWEFIPAYFVSVGLRGGVVARRVYYEKYERLLSRLRLSKGFRVFYRDESPREILKALKNNEVVGILADQDVRKLDGVFVEFFGRPAYTPTAPVLIAMKTGAPLIPARIVREGRKHRIIIDEPIPMRVTGDREADIVHNTQAWSRCIERYIREHPDQWVWMHRRWRTRPEDVARRGILLPQSSQRARR
ncbi:MAG: lysophospholipid acyltransferase family protein [Chlamydiota bacterium]